MFQVADSRDGRGALLGVRGLGLGTANVIQPSWAGSAPSLQPSWVSPPAGRQCWWESGEPGVGRLRCANVYAKSSNATKREAVEPFHFGVRGLGLGTAMPIGWEKRRAAAEAVAVVERASSNATLAVGSIALLSLGILLGRASRAA